jgi:hypothetical protein
MDTPGAYVIGLRAWYPSAGQGSVATCEMETVLQNRIKIHYMSLKADRSDSLVAGIEGSKFARGMDVCLLCLYVVFSCVGRGLCNGRITRPEESYRVSNCMCNQETSKGALCSSWETKRKWMNEYELKAYHRHKSYTQRIH